VARHLAAIHVLKAKLGLSDDDYRALLWQLTGTRSAKACTEAQQRQLRDHLQRLAEKLGVASPRPPRPQTETSAMERKVWALWLALARKGAIQHSDAPALRAWVKRQTGMDDLRFCNWAQLDKLIEALKKWDTRA